MSLQKTLIFINKGRIFYSALFVLAFLFSASGQTKKFNLNPSFPSGLSVCGKSDSVILEWRNVSSSSVANVLVTVNLPIGVYYEKSSLIGSGVSESNISNLNAPVFNMGNFSLAGYVKMIIKVHSTCDLSSYVGKGNPAITYLNLKYTGGSESHQSGSVNVQTPNILISSITNQIINAYLNDKFVRKTTIKNTGKGGASEILFYRTNGNGLIVNSNRSADKYSADSIISYLSASDFQTVGNKDAYLDANEEIILIDTVLVKRCTNLTSKYNVQFGCSGSICNASTKNALVNLDPFKQDLKISAFSNIDWCFNKSKPSSNGVIVVNNCNKPIQYAEINIIQSYNGGFYSAQMSAIDTATITITKGKHGPSVKKVFTQFNYGSNGSYFSCLGSDPIAGFTLNLGDMDVSDTIYITWNTISCITDRCNITLVANRWRYSANFQDPCGNFYSTTEAWGNVGALQYLRALPWIPTDLIANVPDALNFNISSVATFPPSARARYTVKLTLPNGIKHSLNANDVKFTDIYGKDWKPYSVKQSGYDVFAYFNKIPISLLKADLNVIIEADCQASKPSGNKTFDLKILYVPDSTCNQNEDFELYCHTGTLKVHCTQTCSRGGMLFKAFVVKRKNYGLPDNDNDGLPDASGTLDFTKVKTNTSFQNDTISAYYSGIVQAAGSNNIFFNGKIKSSISNGYLFKPIGAILNIYRNGKLRYSCSGMPYKTWNVGTVMFCEIDLNKNSAQSAGCGNMSNYFFLASDSVVVNFDFIYETSIGSVSGEAFFNNSEFYLSTTSNPTSAQKLQCDTLSGRHLLMGSYFTNYYYGNHDAISCSPVTLTNSFYFSAGTCCSNYAGGNPFPFEYRFFNYLEKMKISIPKGYTFDDAYIYYYRSAGTSKNKLQIATKLKPILLSSDTLLFDFDTLFNATTGIFQRSDEGYQGTLVLSLKAGCQAAQNTYETVTYNSYFKWPATGVTTLINNYPDQIKFDHPKIILNAINSVSVSNKDTFTWDVIVSNANNGSSIDKFWFANSEKLKANIISIRDMATMQNLPKNNDIFQAGYLSSSAARIFRVSAISSQCKLDSIKLAMGWNCSGYPDSLEVYECQNLLNKVNLILSPQPPLIISTLLEDTARTDVCTNRKFEAIIANVDEDNIYHLKLKVTIPQGMTFVDTGMYAYFPVGSKPIKLSKPVLVSGTTYEYALSDSLSVLANGLSRVSDTSKSKIRIQFYLESNCQITAGAFVSIMPEGKIGCGEPARRVGYTGQPIRIKGVDNPYFTLISLTPDSINLCQPDVSFNAKVIYLGPTKTLSNDSIILRLPLGFVPDTASLKTTKINGRGTVQNINQQMLWYWSIPAGMSPGDSSLLSFKIKITNKAPDCGLEPFNLQSVTKKKAFCVKTNDSCEINVATGNFYKALKIERANPVLKMIYSWSVNEGDSGEMVHLSFSATNTKKPIDTSMQTKFYLIVDQNANGKFDKNEKVLSTFKKTFGWLSNQIVISHTQDL